MSIVAAPKRQANHNHINTAIGQWLDIHFGDTSFNGRVVIGHRKNGGGIYTMSARPLNTLQTYIRMIHVSNRLDYYITANTVSGIDRRETGLFGLQNIVIDIDCHNKNIPNIPELVETFIWRFKRDMDIIPQPNSVVRTGRGVQLWWALVPGYGANRYYYDKIKNNFMDHIDSLLSEYSELDGLGVDRGASMNPVGYFRLPCTYNTKAKKYSSLEILHDKRYTQQELMLVESSESVAPETTSPTQTITLLDTDINVLKNFHSTGVKRVIQLIKLRNLRNNSVGAETRNNFNFAVYNSLRMTYGHEDAIDRLQAFNAGFTEPMSERELENCIVTAKKLGGYKYSNQKLIELLDISEEEQNIIGLYPFNGKYRPWNHSKPNASRDEVRRMLKDDRNSKIIAMVVSGLSQAETARQLGVGKNTVGRVMKQYRKDTPVIAEISPREECPHSGAINVLCTIPRTYTDTVSSVSKPKTEGVLVIPFRGTS